MLLLLTASSTRAVAAAAAAAASSTYVGTVAPTPLPGVVDVPLAEGARPRTTVALVVLLDGSRLLDLLPCPVCCRQLGDRALDVVEELIPQTTHQDDDIEPFESLPPSLSVCRFDCHHRHPQSHETTVFPHNALGVLTDSLLLILGDASEASSNGVPVIHLFSNLSRKS